MPAAKLVTWGIVIVESNLSLVNQMGLFSNVKVSQDMFIALENLHNLSNGVLSFSARIDGESFHSTNVLYIESLDFVKKIMGSGETLITYRIGRLNHHSSTLKSVIASFVIFDKLSHR